MTLPLVPVSDPNVQFNFDRLASLFLDTGNRQIKVRFGKQASCATGDTTITHGMGSTPVSVVVTPSYDGGSVAFDFVVKSVSSTNFVVTNGSATTTDLFWVAFG